MNLFSRLHIISISVKEEAMSLYYWPGMFLNRSVNPEASQHLTTLDACGRYTQIKRSGVRVSVLNTLLFHADSVASSAKWRVCSLSLHNKFHAVVSPKSAALSIYLINLSKHLLLSHTEWQEGRWWPCGSLESPGQRRQDSEGGSKWWIRV